MNNEEKILAILEQLTTDVSSLKEGQARLEDGQARLEARVDRIDQTVTNLETQVNRIDQTVTRIEHDHGKKLTALFDGNEQHTQMLERIQNDVAAQEDFVLRRVFSPPGK